MEKRGWIQNKYLIKAYVEDMSYESAKLCLILHLISYSISDMKVEKKEY